MTATSSPPAAPPPVADPRPQLFGHPRGLTVLATTEMWERFSFYGMQALLLLYMTKYLLLPGHAEHVLGLAAFRATLTQIVGPLSDFAFATQIYGIYSGLIFGTPLIGAWLGDRVLGRTRTITIGCLLMAAGHLTMASEHLFLVALLLIVLGAGGVIGNMVAQVGQLYAPDDERRTRAFGVYLITLNIGALAAPLLIGTAGEKIGWHVGFGIAGIGMLIGLATYLAGRRYLPPDVLTKRGERVRLTPVQRRQFAGCLLLMLPYILYSAANFQAYGVMYTWADTAVDRVILGWEVPVTWIGIADGLLTIAGVTLANRTWIAMARRGREPGDFTKIAVGFGGVGLAFLFAAGIAMLPVVPVLLWIAFYAIMDLAVGVVEPTFQSLISSVAPPSVNALTLTLLKACNMPAYLILAQMGRFYEPLGPSLFWAVTGAQALIAAAIIILAAAPLRRLLHGGEAEAEGA